MTNHTDDRLTMNAECETCGEYVTGVIAREHGVSECHACYVSGLAHGHAHGLHQDADGTDIYVEDCPTCRLIVEQLAAAFVVRLKATLTSEAYAAVCRLNAAESDPNICHSHDVCDANEVMDEAFTAVGRIAPAPDENPSLWNEAWAIAFTLLSR